MVDRISFSRWAYGDGPFQRPARDRLVAWNQRHGHIHAINEDDLLANNIDKMCEIYEREVKNGG